MRHDSHYVDTLTAPTKTIGRKIAIDLVEPNPEQPRTEFGDLSELTASITEKGVLEPLLVRPDSETGRFMIIAGERRWRASKLAGLTEVPCIEMDLDEQGVAEIALIENLQRKDLNVWEEADGLAALAEKYGYTQEQIAQKISKSRSAVSEFMTIAGLPLEIRERCRDANITQKTVLLEVARQFDDAAMDEYLDRLATGTAVPKVKQEKRIRSRPGVTGGTTKSSCENVTESVCQFSYSGSEPDFQLSLRFSGVGEVSRAEILRALKSTFDAVKSEGADR
jgi:ParB family transcriptional regulator, chromosome partitioning protein